MSLSRRDFSTAAALAATASLFTRGTQADPATTNTAPSPTASPTASHADHGMPAHWVGKEQIALVIYPGFTALDMVGPHYMFTSLIGAKVHVVARTREPVTSDAGLIVTPSMSFDESPEELDLIFLPGGTTGTLAAMQDESTLRYIKHRGQRAKHVTSVCTGSLLLGAAGLLEGYRATSHWITKPLLPIFGATPTDGRVVQDRNRITGGGVTAGLDFGLVLVAMMRDPTYAQGVQLLAEYAPDPPFNAGTPERASKDVKDLLEGMYTDFLAQAESIGRKSFMQAKLL